MRILIYIGLLLLLLSSCSHRQSNSSLIAQIESSKSDTIVGKKTITDEIAGSAYRKRAIGYFVINGKDTSKFTCIFIESKDSGKICIDLNLPYFKEGVTYKQIKKELQKILCVAKNDFNFNLLYSIHIGRLIQIGDIAIEVSKQYTDKFGFQKKITDYRKVESFLKESQLGKDFDNLLNPYSFVVSDISSEKVFFTSKRELLFRSKVDTDTTKIPEKILDCMTWIILKKK